MLHFTAYIIADPKALTCCSIAHEVDHDSSQSAIGSLMLVKVYIASYIRMECHLQR